MSLVARDAKTKQIVSAIMAKDWNCPLVKITMENLSQDA